MNIKKKQRKIEEMNGKYVSIEFPSTMYVGKIREINLEERCIILNPFLTTVYGDDGQAEKKLNYHDGIIDLNNYMAILPTTKKDVVNYIKKYNHDVQNNLLNKNPAQNKP